MNPQTPETWTVKEEAAKLGLSERHLWDMIKRHEPPILRFGRKVMFDEVAHKAMCEATGRKDNPNYIPKPYVPRIKKPRNWNQTRADRAEAAARIKATEEATILASALPMPITGSGVYFLISNGRVVYVGQAVDVLARILTHAKEKAFDSWSWVPCPVAELDAAERAHINALLPELNRDHQTRRLRRERDAHG